MARFYDSAKRDSKNWPQGLLSLLGEAVVIDGTSLSDYLYANEAKGEWDLVDDFFNIAPPFERFWVECRAPKELLTPKGRVPWPSRLPKEWGVLFLASEVDKLTESQKARTPTAEVPGIRWVLQATLFAQFNVDPSKATAITPQFSWWFPVLPDGSQPKAEGPRERRLKIEFVSFPGDEINYTEKTKRGVGKDEISEGVAMLTEDQTKAVSVLSVDGGSRFWHPSDQSVIDIIGPSEKEAIEEERKRLRNIKTEAYFQVMSMASDIPKMQPGWQVFFTDREEQLWLPLLQPCLMAVCFMHVKNVRMERIEPPKAVKKKSTQKYGEPVCDYHVLHIQPMKQVLESVGHASETGIRHALHLCRGTFHLYGDQYNKGKLFGKYSGRYFIPAHVRGSIEKGLRDKSYAIEKPKV